METNGSWWEAVREWAAHPVRSLQALAYQRDLQNKPAQVQRRVKQVEAASAAIYGAHGRDGLHGNRATAFLVRRNNEEFVITSAHETNHYVQGSTGFSLDGKHYFLMIKDNHLAFAEHLALNPQGWVRAPNGGLPGDVAFRDIAILKPLTPEASREVYQKLATGPSSHLLRNTLRRAEFRERLNGEELLQATSLLPLTPIPLDQYSPRIQEMQNAPYSLAYYRNRPELIPSTIVRSTTQPSTIRTEFSCSKPVVSGHSGSLLFTVTSTGGLLPLGVMTLASARDGFSEAVRFSEVITGIDALQSGRIQQARDLKEICASLPGKDIWIAADGLRGAPLSSAVKPTAEYQAVNQSKQTKSRCTAR